MRAGVAVVGGGVMGAAAALHLADRADPLAEPVVLLERAGALGAGSSGRSGAILRQHYADPEVARMARDSLAVYAGFEERTGRSVGFRRTGVLTLAGPRAPSWMERVRKNAEMLVSIGVDTRVVDAAEIRRLVPGIRVDDATIAAWEPGGGTVDPEETLEAFVGVARARGAVTRLSAEVRAFEVEGDRVRALATAEGRVEVDAVVVAAGPWTRALLARAGIELPLRCVRPEQHFLALPGRPAPTSAPVRDPAAAALEEPMQRLERLAAERERAETAAPHPVLIDLENGFYARCEPRRERARVGRIDYGGDRELDDPDALDERVDAELCRWARAALTERVPAYSDAPDLEPQAALYTLTPDAQALIGPLPGLANAFVAAGFSGHGFKLAPSVGQGLAQLVRGERVTAFDAEFFSPRRFAGGGRASSGGAFGL